MKRTALCAALAAAFAPAWAQEPDPEVTALTKPESEVSVGLGYWNKDRPRLGTYDGMSQMGAYGLLDAYIRSRDDRLGTWFTLDARNLGLETRELRADWLRQGNYGTFLEYNRAVRDEPYTVYTAARGIGTTTIRVPTPSAPVTALNEYHLGTVREAFGGGFNKFFGNNFEFRITGRTEDKSGERLWGRGGAPEFAAEPINSNISQIEAALAYTGKTFQVQGGYYGSWYKNKNDLVDTANINAAGVISNQYFLSLPLDNEAHQFYVNGGYDLSASTRATFKAAYTRATQDEQIPVGAGVPVFAGAPKNLDGRLDNTLLQAGLTSRATNAFSWLASVRYYESDEKTPQARIIQTAATCPTCVDNTPLSFETLNAKLEGTYRMAYGLSLVGGLEYVDQDRSVPFGNANAAGVDVQRYVPFRAELEETILRLEVRRSLSETINGRLAYLYSKRDGSDFTAAAADAPQANLINPIHVADRDRDKIKLMLDWTPLDPLTLTFNVEYAKDDYDFSAARPYGLREGKAAVYAIDASYALSDAWQMHAWYSRDENEATQIGQRNANSGAAEAVKTANLKDTGDSFGLGITGVLSVKIKGGLDVLYSKNVNNYPESLALSGPGTLYPTSGAIAAVGPLPDINNKLTRVNLHALYVLQRNTELRFDYIYERWQTDDWSWLFANGTPFTYGATTDGTQVVQAPRQTSNFVGARFIYRFQ